MVTYYIRLACFDTIEIIKRIVRFQQFVDGVQNAIGLLFRDRHPAKHVGYTSAFNHFEKALTIARENGYAELEAATLFRRSFIYSDSIEFVERGSDTWKKYASLSVRDAEAAYALRPHISASFVGALAFQLGPGQAYVAQTEQEKISALNLIDVGGNIARQGYRDDSLHVVKLSEQAYRNNKAATLIAMGRYRSAIDELSWVDEHNVPTLKRRKAYGDLLLAQAYIGRGYFEIAATLASDALPIAVELKSKPNIARVANIHRVLKESSYGGDSEVMVLGIKLNKAQQH